MPQRVVLKLQRTSFVTTDALPPVDLVPLPQSEVDGRVEGGRPSSIRVSPLVERRSREFQDAPPIPPTDRPLYSDFSSDSESDLPDNSLNESYLARSRWPPGKASYCKSPEVSMNYPLILVPLPILIFGDVQAFQAHFTGSQRILEVISAQFSDAATCSIHGLYGGRGAGVTSYVHSGTE